MSRLPLCCLMLCGLSLFGCGNKGDLFLDTDELGAEDIESVDEFIDDLERERAVDEPRTEGRGDPAGTDDIDVDPAIGEADPLPADEPFDEADPVPAVETNDEPAEKPTDRRENKSDRDPDAS